MMSITESAGFPATTAILPSVYRCNNRCISDDTIVGRIQRISRRPDPRGIPAARLGITVTFIKYAFAVADMAPSGKKLKAAVRIGS